MSVIIEVVERISYDVWGIKYFFSVFLFSF